MRIDAHQHFWDLGRFDYAWMPPAPSPLREDHLPERLAPILARNRFDGTVLVQANTLIEETHWLLDLASRHEFIRAVVGWVDLADPRLGYTLDQLQRHPKFKGVRHPVQDEPDERWLLREDVIGGLRELGRRGLPYDLLLRPQHLRLVPTLAERVPALRMAIDHLAKPRIGERFFDDWARDLERAAALRQVCCKLSGMVTEAAPDWKAADLRPYVEHALRVFGVQRLMFGSDWPVCRQRVSWKQSLAAFTQSIGAQAMEVRERLLGGTAREFYNI
ncbi:MAG: amidohydrolase family protein [Acidobacteria bacterium]|nr:amidohydrolase family protein [Acidobacteriota bacterium]